MTTSTRTDATQAPLVIEAAITPLRKGEPVRTVDQIVQDARECLDAGAGVIHFHHDFRLNAADSAAQFIDIGQGILEAYPKALYYGDYVQGDTVEQKHSHLAPMHEAGVLRMLAFDPGLTVFARMDADGLPSDSITGGTTYAEADRLTRLANQYDAPVSIGVFEPGNLRWIKPYGLAGKFPAGSIIKLYFGGNNMMGWDDAEGVTFGLPPRPEALDMYLSMVDGVKLPWVVSLLGGDLLNSSLVRHALARGGHIRVGIEDYAGKTRLTRISHTPSFTTVRRGHEATGRAGSARRAVGPRDWRCGGPFRPCSSPTRCMSRALWVVAS